MIVEVHNIITMIKANILLVRFVSYSPVHFGACKWQPLRGRESLISIICCLFLAGNIRSSVLDKTIPLAFLFGLCCDIDVKQIYERIKNINHCCEPFLQFFFCFAMTRKILIVNIFEPSLSELSRTSGLQEGVRWNHRHLGRRSKLAYESMT